MSGFGKIPFVCGAAAFATLLILPGLAAADCVPGAINNDPAECDAAAAAKPVAPEASPAAPAGAGAAAPEKILTGTVEPIPGPKRTVAVGRFDAIGAFTAKYGNWDIGGGLGAMLTTALVESQRFIVVEREHLQKVLTEQELKGNRLTNQATGPDLGKLIGVQFLIFASVTEFGADDEGGGFSLGFSGGGLGSLLSNAISTQSASGKVAIDVRIVDTTTGRVVETHRVAEAIDNSGWDVSLGYKGVSLGTNQFYKTPLGAAARAAITRAVQLIAASAKGVAWTGQVVEFDAGEIYINAGASSGLKAGDTFMIERVVKRLTDPTTNEVLMLRKKSLGIVQLKTVMPKVAFGPFQPLEPDTPKRGDLVVVVTK